LREVAADLDVPLACAEEALAVVQSLDPTGVGARTCAECLALQAKEADRYDPCMARLIDNLELVARGEFARLKRMCDVDDEDFAEMLGELRSYDPKPGLQFGGGERAPVCPTSRDRQRRVRLGHRAQRGDLPRLVVNRSYYVELREGCIDKASKSWLGEKLADAKALIKALDQRQKTILKVAAEIVKQQEGFFRQGVSQLKPLTLRAVAEAVSLHESTVSRVTSNKYLNCKRGTFETQVLLHQRRRLGRRRRRGLGRGGQGANPRAVRRRGRGRHPVRRPAGRPAARERLRPGAAHGRQIPRGDRHRLLGPAARQKKLAHVA
jgi:RNA polymerase sigma-54 factor